MKAVVLHKTGSPDILSVTEVAMPTVKAGWILIRIKAFGINRSELIMRQSEGNAPYITLPRIIGIECVGEVEHPSDSSFKKGDKVVALMGGMGRSFDGSYAEYALLPTKNVFAVQTSLSWEELGAIPETYFTAYCSLFDCLQLKQGETILVRGATSATGLAAVQMAKAAGAIVLATTRREEKRDFLKQQGANHVLIDNGTVAQQIRKLCPNGVNKVLELVGAATLKESLQLTAHHGIVCHTGILGKKIMLDNFEPIKDIPNGVYLSSFFSNYPTQQIIDSVFHFIESHRLHPTISRTFTLDEVSEAHHFAESNLANGKIVIKL